MRDQLTEKLIQGLHPKARPLVIGFIEECQNTFDITLRIVQGFRTFAEQDHIYAQGRTSPGKIVTAAKGGQSYHCFGLAIDVVPIIEEKSDWNWNFSAFNPIAQKYGFTWGHAWDDNDHFELDFGHGASGWKYFLALHNEGEVDGNGFVIFPEVFEVSTSAPQAVTPKVEAPQLEAPIEENLAPQVQGNEIIKEIEGEPPPIV